MKRKPSPRKRLRTEITDYDARDTSTMIDATKPLTLQRIGIELVREAVGRMLDDVEDLELAERARAASRPTKPLAKLRKELGLDR